MEYPKINSLWKREGWYFDKSDELGIQKNTRKSFIVGDYADSAFGNVLKWRVDEKIDGTNIRIFFDRETVINAPTCVRFGGRTKDAQIPCHLLDYLQKAFTTDLIDEVFPLHEAPSGILYGEGYGPKIQSGGYYSKTPSFILYDIRVGNWWLKREDVREISKKLNIKCVPEFGIMTEDEIVDLVKSKPLSLLAQEPHMIEGVVCRSDPLLLLRNGKPLMWKLKCRDFDSEAKL